jgi:carbon-monoxide dehydrogenase large subunit
LGRPVAWTETRTENLINMVHGRGQVQYAQLGAKRDGTLVGLKARVRHDAGAYPTVAASLGKYSIEMASGVYDIPKIEVVVEATVTNRTPIGPYRGAGRPEAAQLIERMMDLMALELEMDPVEIRRKNVIPPFDATHQTASGAIYDSGEYEKLLDLALEKAGWADLKAEREARIVSGASKQLGLGVSLYAETNIGTTPKNEFGAVKLNDDGTVTVRIGGTSHGQGHDTTFSQMVADQFAIDQDRVVVLQSDTRHVPEGISGTFGSRTLQLAGSSAWVSAETVIGLSKRLAAEKLEASLDDMVIRPNEGIGVVGSPEAMVTWEEIAAIAKHKGEKLEAEETHASPGSTYPFGAHVAVVEVEMDTGWVRLLRHIAVDDSGTIINPMIAMGQQHGGVVQGIGQALFEEFRYDDAGYPMTGNLTSYMIPAIGDVPMIETHRSSTQTSYNPLGAKGIGESGTLGSTPAIHSAVMDVLARHGVRHMDMPLTPNRVWQALNDASEE